MASAFDWGGGFFFRKIGELDRGLHGKGGRGTYLEACCLSLRKGGKGVEELERTLDKRWLKTVRKVRAFYCEDRISRNALFYSCFDNISLFLTLINPSKFTFINRYQQAANASKSFWLLLFKVPSKAPVSSLSARLSDPRAVRIMFALPQP